MHSCANFKPSKSAWMTPRWISSRVHLAKIEIDLFPSSNPFVNIMPSRWCIETGYETIEYHFPIQYQGYSSDTHLRVFTIQTIVFNSYRVAQIKHIGATKPANWRPWEPKNKTKCRRFDAKDQRSFSTKTHLLGLLKESLEAYFCRALS